MVIKKRIKLSRNETKIWELKRRQVLENEEKQAEWQVRTMGKA